MKHLRFFVLALLPLLLFVGCNGGTTQDVDNPPEFVEMYLDPESDIVFGVEEVAFFLKKADDTTTDTETTDSETTTEPVGPVYDGSFYSETDFEVIVVTSGANYDLLFSVELTDSLLGSCVYTNQSTLYHATSTVVVETDGSYTTTVVLTIPGSTDSTSYLSERTISLSKILFSRDTVDGTFPADIPTNTTTELLFEVHARKYFDETLGLPLEVNEDGLLDVILTPNSEFYAQAEALGKTVVELPETVNGYAIGAIFLQDLPWIETLSLSGASDHVFLLGDFAALTTLECSAFSFPDMLSNPKDLTINGSFPLLTGITLDNIDRYHFYLSNNSYSEDVLYQNYVDVHEETLYDFPSLATIVIENNCRMGLVRIGKDTLGLPFPALVSISVLESYLSELEIGAETNEMEALASITVTDSWISSIAINGTKSPENPAATLTLIGTDVDYSLQVKGSLIGPIILTETNLGGLTIDGGTINDSRFSGISAQNLTFEGGMGLMQIIGSHPDLTSITLSGLELTEIFIGGIGSVFSSLQSIHISGIDVNHLYIGDRDAVYPALEEILLDDVTVDLALRIGGEFVVFPELTEIWLTNSEVYALTVGGDDFDKVIAIILSNVVFGGSIQIGSVDTFLALESIVLEDISCLSFFFSCNTATYDLYAVNLIATSGLSLSVAQCLHVYVPEVDPTTWTFYDYANNLGIPVLTGTYTPE